MMQRWWKAVHHFSQIHLSPTSSLYPGQYLRPGSCGKEEATVTTVQSRLPQRPVHPPLPAPGSTPSGKHRTALLAQAPVLAEVPEAHHSSGDQCEGRGRWVSHVETQPESAET